MSDASSDGRGQLGVGMVGVAFMGAAHSQAWRSVGRFFDLPVEPRMRAVAATTLEHAQQAASRLGWESAEPDWQSLIKRDDIAVVDVVTPGDTHAEIAIAALEAGKHVLCEKPLANTVAEAEAMAKAAEAARANGVRSMVGFTYRRVPAIAYARQLVADGRLGQIRHVRAQYLQDWITDPEFPLVWRLRKDKAGSGALGDIGAHIIDLAQYITGQRITGVNGLTETFIKQRPLPTESTGLSAGAASGQTGEVTVDDAALFLARFTGGAIGTFEATRFASGRKNAIRLEINGSDGSLAFDFEAMNELWFYDHTSEPEVAGFRRILVTESTHPYVAAWWPPGHLLGYEHGFTNQARDFVVAVAEGTDPHPSFEDGLNVQRVMAAVEDSAASNGEWTTVHGVEGR
jgi:predicted dehydrogenase